MNPSTCHRKYFRSSISCGAKSWGVAMTTVSASTSMTSQPTTRQAFCGIQVRFCYCDRRFEFRSSLIFNSRFNGEAGFRSVRAPHRHFEDEILQRKRSIPKADRTSTRNIESRVLTYCFGKKFSDYLRRLKHLGCPSRYLTFPGPTNVREKSIATADEKEVTMDPEGYPCEDGENVLDADVVRPCKHISSDAVWSGILCGGDSRASCWP